MEIELSCPSDPDDKSVSKVLILKNVSESHMQKFEKALESHMQTLGKSLCESSPQDNVSVSFVPLERIRILQSNEEKKEKKRKYNQIHKSKPEIIEEKKKQKTDPEYLKKQLEKTSDPAYRIKVNHTGKIRRATYRKWKKDHPDKWIQINSQISNELQSELDCKLEQLKHKQQELKNQSLSFNDEIAIEE